MEIIGNGRLMFSKPEDERPHLPGPDKNWQESMVLYVFDAEQQCYAFFRIGHEPHQGPTGTAVIWINIWVPGQYYKYYEDVPLSPEDRFPDGQGSGTRIRYEYDGKHHWTVKDGDISASFVMEDWHKPFDFWPERHNLGEIAANHMEAGGTVSGTIQFQGRTFIIKGAMGHRDHSWGVRRWEAMRTHRWVPSLFGPDLSSHAMAMLTDDGQLMQFGFVIRDGKFYVPTDTKVIVFLEADGLSNRGGVVNYTFPSGEKVEINFRNIVPGGVSYHRGYPCIDPISVATCGDRTGFGVMETGNNTLNGHDKPKQGFLIGGYIDNGVFPYETGSSIIRRP